MSTKNFTKKLKVLKYKNFSTIISVTTRTFNSLFVSNSFDHKCLVVLSNKEDQFWELVQDRVGVFIVWLHNIMLPHIWISLVLCDSLKFQTTTEDIKSWTSFLKMWRFSNNVILLSNCLVLPYHYQKFGCHWWKNIRDTNWIIGKIKFPFPNTVGIDCLWM